MLTYSGQSSVPLLVRPPAPAGDVSYDVVPEHVDESVEQQSVSAHGTTTSRLVILSVVNIMALLMFYLEMSADRNKAC